MATKIGSNFDYKGPLFLDSRQGQVSRKEDLKVWDTLIPEGYKVCVGNADWYIFDSSKPQDPVTGKFHPIFDSELGTSTNTTLSQKAIGEEFGKVNESILEIEGAVWPLEFKSISGGGYFTIGQEVTPTISWELTRRGKGIDPQEATINGSTSGLTIDKKMFTSSTPIKVNTNYIVRVKADGLWIEKTISYIFSNKRYFGTSPKTTLTSSDVQGLGFSDWEQNNKLAARYFNCTGGKYPWFCIPTSVYSKSKFDLWVGGLQVSDVVESKVNVVNVYGVTTEYTCIRLSSLQTGNLPIELK